jgi:hypothetical protein
MPNEATHPSPASEGASGEAVARLACKSCGSPRIRRSRARTRGEILVRLFTPIHFHICRDCGKRSWHLGGSRVPLMLSDRRRVESPRTGDVERSRKPLVYGAVLVTFALGVGLGLGLRSCDSKPTPPSTTERLH